MAKRRYDIPPSASLGILYRFNKAYSLSSIDHGLTVPRDGVQILPQSDIFETFVHQNVRKMARKR